VGALPAGGLDSVLTSPPFLQTAGGLNPPRGGWNGHAASCSELAHGVRATRPGNNFGASPGQVGLESGETYWQAVRQIYGQCLSALKPGGTLCVVVKSYVKGGKLVDLPGQTRALLEHLGFRVFLEVRALLVRESREPGLFEPEVVRQKSRKSFFRRLAERKGSPAVDHECVLFARKEDLP
jgi:hypothetical protein